MFKHFYLLILMIVALASCEDVIEVDLPQDDPRIVVGGLLRVDTTQTFVDVNVKITQTNSFFQEVLPVSGVDNIYILFGLENEYGEIEGGGAICTLSELEPGSGIYEFDPFITGNSQIRTEDLTPQFVFWLIMEYQERRYAAKTYYRYSVPITTVEQGDGTLFDESETEVILSYTDKPDEENFYLFDFDFGNFLTSEDTFYPGQPFSFSYFYDNNLSPGDEVSISILGIDEDFYNYMNLLIEQSEGGFGPFETPAATVRGNVFDVTGIDNINQFDNVEQPNNFPLGYFAVVQEFKSTIVIE